MKMTTHQNTILTDVDGVLLDWDTAFHQWLVRHNHEKDITSIMKFKRENETESFYRSRHADRIAQFNSSAEIGFIRPFRDSVPYVKRLAEEGFKFVAISSFSDNLYSHALRKRNLTELFGDVFQEFHFLPLGESKKEILSHYAGTGMVYVDDIPKHVSVGLELGLQAFLMKDWHTKSIRTLGSTDDPDLNAIVIDGWQEVYQYIKAESAVLSNFTESVFPK